MVLMCLIADPDVSASCVKEKVEQSWLNDELNTHCNRVSTYGVTLLFSESTTVACGALLVRCVLT